MAMTSAWWMTRSTRAVALVALGKMDDQSEKARFVGEHDTLLLVAQAQALIDQVRVAIVVGEVADLIDDQHTDAGVVFEPAVEGARGVLRREIEQQLRGGDEEDAVSRADGP